MRRDPTGTTASFAKTTHGTILEDLKEVCRHGVPSRQTGFSMEPTGTLDAHTARWLQLHCLFSPPPSPV